MMSSSGNPLLPSPPRLVLLFHFRSLLESADLDRLHYEAWSEVLGAFGYTALPFASWAHDELSLKSAQEVMTSLCPYTTTGEWGPLLNKRDVRLQREVESLCLVEVLPLAGLREFLVDCARHSQLSVVCLSALPMAVMQLVLQKSELSAFVDLIVPYSEWEFGALEALEALRVRPPVLPTRLHHIWEGEEQGAHTEDTDQQQEEENTMIIAFDTECSGVRHHRAFGLTSIGVTANEWRSDDDVEVAPAVASESALLQSGAAVVVKDYQSLRFEYLASLCAHSTQSSHHQAVHEED